MLAFRRMIVLAFVFNAVRNKEVAGQRTLHRLVGGHLKILPDDTLDAELLTSESGGRPSRQQKLNEDEDKKTLSQQVADGKYGLIQKEIFGKPPKRPGVISYESNSEVPKDNIGNLGGLSKNDIWLAENHLLVLRGGRYPTHNDRPESTPSSWAPIDDYKAPNRQVKIPAHPKVPPPFPVQLSDGGPLQILGTNSSRTINGSLESQPYPLPPPEDFDPDGGPFFPPPYPYPANATAGEAPFPIPPFPPGDYYPGDGSPPFPFPINGTLPPFFGSLPPGAAFLPPPGNQTEPIDEDDPSIYYPPPYSFFYPKDNSTLVPPGPLVPGIVLPPPPNFFAPLEDDIKPTTRLTTTRTTTELVKQIHPTTTPLPPTPIIQSTHFKVPANIPEHNELKPTTAQVTRTKPVLVVTTKKPYTPVERHPSHNRKKPPSVTILRPIKTSTTPAPGNFYESNEVSGKPFAMYGPPPGSRSRTIVSTTQVPLRSYYSTSNELEANTMTERPEPQYYNTRSGISTLHVPKTTAKPPAQYYFYEEDKNVAAPTVQTLPPQKEETYLNIPKEYYVQAKPVTRQPTQRLTPVRATQQPPQNYFYVNQSPKPDTYSVHIAKLKQQIHSYYPSPRPRKEPYYTTTTSPAPKPIYQFSFEAANYQQQHDAFRSPQVDNEDKFRPLPRYSVQIQPAVEVLPTERPQYQNTPPPQVYFQPKYQTNTERPASSQYYSTRANSAEKEYVITPRPISQYSFEVTQNPIYEQGYYTKQDERLFDDITKKYFTIFGKKLANTSPIPKAEVATQKPYNQPTYVHENPVQIEYAQSFGEGVSLHGDTYVNYLGQHVRNPNAEYVQQAPKFVQRSQNHGHPLHSDINVNYKQRPPINTNAEIVEAINVPLKAQNEESKTGSYISYELPGDDGAHFYFLTPQLAQRRDQGVGYYYSQPNTPRIRRNDMSNGS